MVRSAADHQGSCTSPSGSEGAASAASASSSALTKISACSLRKRSAIRRASGSGSGVKLRTLPCRRVRRASSALEGRSPGKSRVAPAGCVRTASSRPARTAMRDGRAWADPGVGNSNQRRTSTPCFPARSRCPAGSLRRLLQIEPGAGT